MSINLRPRVFGRVRDRQRRLGALATALVTACALSSGALTTSAHADTFNPHLSTKFGIGDCEGRVGVVIDPLYPDASLPFRKIGGVGLYNCAARHTLSATVELWYAPDGGAWTRLDQKSTTFYNSTGFGTYNALTLWASRILETYPYCNSPYTAGWWKVQAYVKTELTAWRAPAAGPWHLGASNTGAGC